MDMHIVNGGICMSILNVEKFQSKSEDKNYLKNLEKIKKDTKYIENQKQI